MLKKLFYIIKLYILKINIYIFPDNRTSLNTGEKEPVTLPFDGSNNNFFNFNRLTNSGYDENFKNRTVLLGVFRNIFQFEICLEKNFYYIPYELIEGFEDKMEYIALYQSKNLFGFDAGIRYYGKISSFEILNREQIEEIPTENTGLYCKFIVDSWDELDNIIQPKEIGFIREFTTFYLLQNSREVPQLFAESETEFNLYNAISLAVEYRQKINYGEYCFFTRRGFLLVFHGSKLTHFYHEKDFRLKPGATVKNIIHDTGIL